jgi:anti-anti-sigma factor
VGGNFKWSESALVRVERPEPGVAAVSLLGEHDLATAAQFESLLGQLRRDDLAVIVDVTEASFVDSAILHTLLQARDEAKEQGEGFVLQLGTRNIVQRAFEVSGLLQRLVWATTREEAMSLARDRRSNP